MRCPALLLALCACVETIAPSSDALVVTPTEAYSGANTRIIISGDFSFASAKIDYEASNVPIRIAVVRLEGVRLESRPVEDHRCVGPTCLEAVVPAGMPIGPSTLTVTDAANDELSHPFAIYGPAEIRRHRSTPTVSVTKTPTVETIPDADHVVDADPPGPPRDWFGDGDRMRITITASAAVPAGYAFPLSFDHDGRTVRIIRHDVQPKEIARVFDPQSAPGTPSTTIWFQLEDPIPAGGVDDSYYAYLGGTSTAAPHADPNRVFMLFDDFETGATGHWSGTYLTPGASVGVVNNASRDGSMALRARVPDGGVAEIRSIHPGEAGIRLTAWVRLPIDFLATHEVILHFMCTTQSCQGGAGQLGGVGVSPALIPFIDDLTGPGIERNFGVSPLRLDNWHRIELRTSLSAQRSELWVDGQRSAVEDLYSVAPQAIGYTIVGIFWKPQGFGPETVYVDTAFFSRWVYPEPTATIGTMETY